MNPIGNPRASEEAMQIMCERIRPGQRFAAYQNVALDSAGLGELQFLKVGDGCTFRTPPQTYPADTAAGLGWRFRFCGHVDLTTGEIQSASEGSTHAA